MDTDTPTDLEKFVVSSMEHRLLVPMARVELLAAVPLPTTVITALPFYFRQTIRPDRPEIGINRQSPFVVRPGNREFYEPSGSNRNVRS